MLKEVSNEAGTEICRIDGSQCNQVVWGRAFHQENVRQTDTVESDWASLTRKAEQEAQGYGQSDRLQDRERTLLLSAAQKGPSSGSSRLGGGGSAHRHTLLKNYTKQRR